MSVESLAVALNHSRATGSARLVLMGIANHDGDGGAWPAIDTLSRYAGGITRRNTIKALDRLEALGEIKRMRQAGGNSETANGRRPNLYKFLLRCPASCDRSSQHRVAGVSTATPLSGVDSDTPETGWDVDSDTGRGVGSDTLTTHLTKNSIPIERSTFARETKAAAFRAPRRPASATRKTCANGHPIVATSGGGVDFCELACPAVDTKTGEIA